MRVKDFERNGILIDPDIVFHARPFVWRITREGYVRTSTDNEWGRFLHHLVIGKRPGLTVDHINRNPLDNRRVNLRHVTGRESQRNRSTADRKLPHYVQKVGVKYVVNVKVDGKSTHFGTFKSLEKAEQRVEDLKKLMGD